MQLFSEIYILYDTYCSQLVLTKLIIGLSPDLKERFWTFPSNSALLNIIKIESLLYGEIKRSQQSRAPLVSK